MSKFKVGDRVAVYEAGTRYTGTFNCEYSGKAEIVLDNDDGVICAHPKQCRKLKPKAKAPRGKVGGRVLYLRNEDVNHALSLGCEYDITGSSKPNHLTKPIKFIEAE